MKAPRPHTKTVKIQDRTTSSTPMISSLSKASLLLLLLSLSAGITHADLSTGLVAYYDFESGITDQSGSATANDGTYQTANPITGTGAGFAGSAAYAGGNDDGGADSTTDRSDLLVGNALNIAGNTGADGSGAFFAGSLTANGAGGGSLGDNFTISSWFYVAPDADTSDQRHFIFEPRSNFGGSGDNYNISFGSKTIRGATGTFTSHVGQHSAPQTTMLTIGAWHHVLHTFASIDGNTTMDVYINGALTTSDVVQTAEVSFTGINFGMHRGETGRALDGMMDEVALWDRALTTTELATVYALGLNSAPVISSDPLSTAPIINSFTATPSTIAIAGNSTLGWNVTGSTAVTIVEDLNNVSAIDNQSVPISSETTYTLVAINGNATKTAQVTINFDGPSDPVGPYVGTVKQTEAYFLYSPGQEELTLRLTVMTEEGATVTSADSTCLAANDYVAQFHTIGLTAGTNYRYKVEKVAAGGTILFAGDTAEHRFKTVPTERTGQIVTAGFISCINDTTDAIWTEMGNHNLDLLCLAGDTPYVDTGKLTSIRSKHRHFLQRPTLAPLLGKTSVVGTWDDHDFGLNNGNGLSTASRKVNTRKGFTEYRAHDQYGDGSGSGVYHKTDLGAMEVFLLDPRWFSQTEASPVDANQSTCFGATQWQWLLDSIRNSEAPFKILVQGQIWQDKKNSETDDMFTYYTERDALLNMIRDENIPGVVIFGGDIHVARYLMHPQRVGYDLHDFIMSPGHKSVISSLNVYHPSLEWSRVSPNQFLTMKADTTKSVPELTVRYLDETGSINYELVISYDQLSQQSATGLAKDLRALWTFDSDLTNQSVLGSRIDATAVNGATRVNTGGIRGGALDLTRADSQYVSVPRSFLDDNASTYSVSSWCKATTLPAHGSGDRHFIMESMVNNHVNLRGESTGGYAISVGLRATTDSQKINLQLYTETLSPKAVGSKLAPGVTDQGFSCDVDRTLFTGSWANAVVTFDSSKASNNLQLYLNGALIKEHTLTIAAPIAETGGLIIGGHRAGTGRNFDGLIDEVAIWNRVLTPADITTLYNSGTPAAIPTAASLPDTDGDALPDYWENIHGLAADDDSDASTDVDNDGLDAMQEFGFGTLPKIPTQPHPYQQSMITLSEKDYLAITYQRALAAGTFLDIMAQSSTDLGLTDKWSNVETNIVSITPLANGLEEIVERSTVAMSTIDKEFLRIQFSKP